MTDEQVPGVPVQEAPKIEAVAEPITNENIQAANIASLEKQDPLTAGLQEPMKMAGPAKQEAPKYGERVDALQQSKDIQKAAEAPVAAPVQQIAPVSANGEQTSARSAPQADAPAIVQESSQVAGSNPSTTTVANNPSEPATSESTEAEVQEDPNDPLVIANNLLQAIPGKLRLY
jgi:hypothetical protein